MPFGFGKKDDGQEKPMVTFNAKYVGGHKAFPKSKDVKVLIYADRIKVTELNIDVLYSSVSNIENADESKISAMRVVLLGVVGALWKKKHVYTVVQYTDPLNEKQTLIFDFEKDMDKAQPLIYQKVLESRQSKTG